MASVTSFLDPKIHRVYALGTTLSAPGSATTVSLQGTTDARYPGGHYLEINPGPGGGGAVRLPAAGLQSPSSLSTASDNHVPVTVDDDTHRVLTLGTELSSDPAHSVTVVNKRDPSNNTVSDTMLYANAAGTTAVSPLDSKTPPHVG
jgi:hypothetical protein